MTPQEIIDNEANILECARSFRHDANFLMTELSKDFNFSLDAAESFPRDIYIHKYNNKGIFRNEWTYYFHGAECRFENLKTGQIVELLYITKPEFGFLNGYFLFNYMMTTDRFKDLALWFVNDTNVWIAMEVLADKGTLTRVTSETIDSRVIAL